MESFLNVIYLFRLCYFIPPKGTRDFPPEIEILRKRIFEKIEKVFQRFGFDPINTPIVEYWETLKGKYGEEAEKKLIWRFMLPYSDKEYALRYDLTVPLARFYSRFKPTLPFKRYCIDRVYRYDEPQKGRYREFWQADFDILGSDFPESDAEILTVVDYTLKKLGFKDYVIKINDRKIIEEVFGKIVKDEELYKKILIAIDKLDKIGIEGVKKELNKIVNEDISNKIISILNDENILEKIPSELYNKLFEIIDLSGIKKIKFDISLVRGLDYYTGMIFETVLENIKIGTVSAGGRYDNLIELFINERVPAVGGSIGVERLIDAGLELGIFKLDKKTYVEIGVVYFKDVLKEAIKIANKLRDLGYNVYIDLNRKKFDKQVNYLVKKDVRYLVIVGEKDLKENLITIHDRVEKKDIKIKIDEIERIKEIIKREKEEF